jgi:hypothetical protein
MWCVKDLLERGKGEEDGSLAGTLHFFIVLFLLPFFLSSSFIVVQVSYFPTTVCALRTLKAELGCGMAPEQTTRAAELDSAWMVNGHFGVIQVAPPCSFA